MLNITFMYQKINPKMFVLRHRSQRQSLLLPLRRHRALLDEGGRLRHHLQTVPVQEQLLLLDDGGLLKDNLSIFKTTLEILNS